MPVARIISILLSITWKQNMRDERGNCLISRVSFPGENCWLLGTFGRKARTHSPGGLGHPIKLWGQCLAAPPAPAAATATSIWVSRDGCHPLPHPSLLHFSSTGHGGRMYFCPKMKRGRGLQAAGLTGSANT